MILGFPIAIGTTVLSERFIITFYGINFINSIKVLQILIWAELLIFLNYVFVTILQSINREKLWMYSTAICLMINIFLNLILIPRLNYIGSAFATITTEFILLILCFYFVSRYFLIFPIHKIIIKPFISSLLMGLFVYYNNNVNLFLLIPISIFLYFTISYLIKSISRDDINILRKMINLNEKR
jgi:O-antigen/teichoic acid export membrane protein